MKKIFLLLALLFFSSCGSLKLSPQGCRTDGYWGEAIPLGKSGREIKLSSVYYVWNVDYEVKLKQLLEEHKIDCSEIKSMRIEISSSYFIKRELTVFVQK